MGSRKSAFPFTVTGARFGVIGEHVRTWHSRVTTTVLIAIKESAIHCLAHCNTER
jgi:hypothetical protein